MSPAVQLVLHLLAREEDVLRIIHSHSCLLLHRRQAFRDMSCLLSTSSQKSLAVLMHDAIQWEACVSGGCSAWLEEVWHSPGKPAAMLACK